MKRARVKGAGVPAATPPRGDAGRGHLVGVVVADDALVLGEAQLAPLIRGQSERGQEARSERVHWNAVVGNWRKTSRRVRMRTSCW